MCKVDRICQKCGAPKPLDEEYFYFRKDTSRFRMICIECMSENHKEYYLTHTEQIKAKTKEYAKKNGRRARSESAKKSKHLWNLANKNHNRDVRAAYRLAHPDRDVRVAYRLAHPEKFTTEARHRPKIIQNYGITEDQYNTLYSHADRFCGICGKKSLKLGDLSLDHDHQNGLIRGLLCGCCNRALGNLGDSMDVLKKAQEYLAVPFIAIRFHQKFWTRYPAQYEILMKRCGGKCQICGSSESKNKTCRKLPVDHDHASGTVRGLLCAPCNAGIGGFREDFQLLESAVVYLVNSRVPLFGYVARWTPSCLLTLVMAYRMEVPHASS